MVFPAFLLSVSFQKKTTCKEVQTTCIIFIESVLEIKSFMED